MTSCVKTTVESPSEPEIDGVFIILLERLKNCEKT